MSTPNPVYETIGHVHSDDDIENAGDAQVIEAVGTGSIARFAIVCASTLAFTCLILLFTSMLVFSFPTSLAIQTGDCLVAAVAVWNGTTSLFWAEKWRFVAVCASVLAVTCGILLFGSALVFDIPMQAIHSLARFVAVLATLQVLSGSFLLKGIGSKADSFRTRS